MSPRPLVSCIMPTRGRPTFALRAIDMFLAQTWEPRELLILDDSADPSTDCSVEMSEPSCRIMRAVDYDHLQIGAKRNLACYLSSGEIILHWDDDDFYAPQRIAHQVVHLLESGKDVTGFRGILFVDLASGERWRYHADTGAVGVSLCYRRAYWERNKFQNVSVAEDGHFARMAEAHASYEPDAGSLIVATIHAGNTSKREPGKFPRQWVRA